MTEFINEYQRQHYEACKRAEENSKKQPLSSAEMRSIALAHREMVRASRMGEPLAGSACELFHSVILV